MSLIANRTKDFCDRLDLANDDDRYWVRPNELAGIGIFQEASVLNGRLHVKIVCRDLPILLDTSNTASFGDLYNLYELSSESRVSFIANARAFSQEGVHCGRLRLISSDEFQCKESVVFTPCSRSGGRIFLGEGDLEDPDPCVESYTLSWNNGVVLTPIRSH